MKHKSFKSAMTEVVQNNQHTFKQLEAELDREFYKRRAAYLYKLKTQGQGLKPGKRLRPTLGR